ncbi:DUF4279 domain-containing protein [bacterium]|nr:DUF4279 domain-containing protein [bacterium]
MDKNEAYAYLRTVEFRCTVDELTRRIGLEPTEAWHAGDAPPPPRQPRKFNAWHLRSRLPTSENVERHVVDVLDQIRGREAVLRDVAQDFGLTMECVGAKMDQRLQRARNRSPRRTSMGSVEASQ